MVQSTVRRIFVGRNETGEVIDASLHLNYLDFYGVTELCYILFCLRFLR